MPLAFPGAYFWIPGFVYIFPTENRKDDLPVLTGDKKNQWINTTHLPELVLSQGNPEAALQKNSTELWPFERENAESGVNRN